MKLQKPTLFSADLSVVKSFVERELDGAEVDSEFSAPDGEEGDVLDGEAGRQHQLHRVLPHRLSPALSLLQAGVVAGQVGDVRVAVAVLLPAVGEGEQQLEAGAAGVAASLVLWTVGVGGVHYIE